MAPLMGQLAEAITGSLAAAVAMALQTAAAVKQLLAAPPGQDQQQLHRSTVKGFSAEQATESTTAATLLSLLVQLLDQAAAPGSQPPELPAELQPAATAAAAMAAVDFGSGVVRLPALGLTLVEACLEVRQCVVCVEAGHSRASATGQRSAAHFTCSYLYFFLVSYLPASSSPLACALQPVGRLLFKQPTLLPALLSGNAEAEIR
jgi:hypothetical protein